MPHVTVTHSLKVQEIDDEGMIQDNYEAEATWHSDSYPTEDEHHVIWEYAVDKVVGSHIDTNEHCIEIVDEEYDTENLTYTANLSYDVTTSDRGHHLLTVWATP